MTPTYAEPCWLAQFSDKPCEGRVIKAHLIPRRKLREVWVRAHRGSLPSGLPTRHKTLSELIDDPRTWIPACGGITGQAGHHGMLDMSRTLRIPWEMIPGSTKHLAAQIGLLPWLEHEYRDRAADRVAV
jgi:hypothetical protein